MIDLRWFGSQWRIQDFPDVVGNDNPKGGGINLLLPPPHWYWHLVVATKTRTVGKWAVRILVEFFLVLAVIFPKTAPNWKKGTCVPSVCLGSTNAALFPGKSMIIIGRLRYQYQIATGADSGFPIGGGADFPGGANLQFCQIFQKTCMKLRKFWAMGGEGHQHTILPNFPKKCMKLRTFWTSIKFCQNFKKLREIEQIFSWGAHVCI